MSAAIVAVLDDLLFTVKIQDAVKRAGLAVVFVKSLDKALELAMAGPPLLILDLNTSALDAVGLILALKQQAATVPVLAYVSHVQVELRERAIEAGADVVLPRSAFVKNLDSLVRQGSGGAE